MRHTYCLILLTLCSCALLTHERQLNDIETIARRIEDVSSDSSNTTAWILLAVAVAGAGWRLIGGRKGTTDTAQSGNNDRTVASANTSASEQLDKMIRTQG